MPKIDVRDIRIHYDRAGEGDMTLLFVHGMCGDAENYRDMFDRLSAEFTCIAYDRRGHSRSEPGTEDQSFRTHVDDLAALVDALDLGRPVLVGSSAGGAISLELLHRYPDHARAAVVIEPPLLNLDSNVGKEFRELVGPRIQEAVDRSGQRAAVDAFFEVVCAQLWEQLNEERRNRLRDNYPMLFAAIQSEGTTITEAGLAGIEHPVLVTSGVDSPEFIRTLTTLVASSLPNARFVEFPDCGHVVYAERPEEFANEVRAFARKLAPASQASPA